MTRLIGPALIGVATAGADAGSRYLEGMPIGATTAISIAIFVGTCVAWLDSRDRKRDVIQAKIDQRIAERLARIEQQISDLPCPGRGRDKCRDHNDKDTTY
jgi:hypothetical protein